METSLKAVIICIHFLLLYSSHTFAQVKEKPHAHRETNFFQIDYVNGNSGSERTTSSLFLHLPDKIIQLKGKTISPDSIAGSINCISIDSLYSLSNKALLHLPDSNEVFVKYARDGILSCYKISDVAVYFSEGSKLFKTNADGEKVMYADLQDSPEKSGAVKKLPDGSLKIDPAKAYGNRTYVRSKEKIGCFVKYEIVAQQGKHSSAVLWIPEVGVVQERSAGYAATEAVQINGMPTEQFLNNMCNSRGKY